MIYLVYGDQEMLVNKMIDRLCKENLESVNEFNYTNLDCLKITKYELEDELNSFSFLGEKKVVSLINANFLTTNMDAQGIDSVIKDYLKQDSDMVILILSVYSNKLDEKKTIVKEIKECSKVIEVNSVNKKELPRVVKQMFSQRGASIDNDALDELIKRVGVNMYEIVNEVDKLTTFSKNISLDDIYSLTPKKIEDNVFDMIDALFKRKVNKAFNIYNDLKNLGNEPIGLIAIIASQVRFLYQVLYLDSKGYSEANIANELSVHPYRVKISMEKARRYLISDFEKMLEELSLLDVKIKTGEVDRFVGLELFILNCMN